MFDVCPDVAPRNFEILFLQPQILVFYESVRKASDRAKYLREYCCTCRACNTPFERLDEKYVKQDVHNRGDEKKNERCERVAYASQYADYEIVEQLRYQSEKNHETIRVRGVVNDFVLRSDVDPCKHRLYAENRRNRKHNRDYQAENELRCERFAHTGFVVRADFV